QSFKLSVCRLLNKELGSFLRPEMSLQSKNCFSKLKRRVSGYYLHFKLVPKFSSGSQSGAFTLRDIVTVCRPLAAKIRDKARDLRLVGYVRLALPQSLARYSAWLEGESSGRCPVQDAFVDWLGALVTDPDLDLLPRLFLRKSAEVFPYASSGSGIGGRGRVLSGLAGIENDEIYADNSAGGSGGGSKGNEFFILSDHIVITDETVVSTDQQVTNRVI
ncbi:hypothetical protein BOX15_Mlig026687g1, partial [Macrostomum lignano]